MAQSESHIQLWQKVAPTDENHYPLPIIHDVTPQFILELGDTAIGHALRAAQTDSDPDRLTVVVATEAGELSHVLRVRYGTPVIGEGNGQ